MEKSSKILITIGIIVVFIILFTVQVGTTGRGGMLGLILMAAAIGGISAIWKKKDNDTNMTKRD